MEIYQILKCFFDGKHKALIISYDDINPNNRSFIRVFNRYDIKKICHLNADLLNDHDCVLCEDTKELYKGYGVVTYILTNSTKYRCSNSKFLYIKDNCCAEEKVYNGNRTPLKGII